MKQVYTQEKRDSVINMYLCGDSIMSIHNSRIELYELNNIVLQRGGGTEWVNIDETINYSNDRLYICSVRQELYNSYCVTETNIINSLHNDVCFRDISIAHNSATRFKMKINSEGKISFMNMTTASPITIPNMVIISIPCKVMQFKT